MKSSRHTDKGISDGYLQPHPVSHLQTGLWAGHCLGNSCHVSVDGKVEVIESYGGGDGDRRMCRHVTKYLQLFICFISQKALCL